MENSAISTSLVTLIRPILYRILSFFVSQKFSTVCSVGRAETGLLEELCLPRSGNVNEMKTRGRKEGGEKKKKQEKQEEEREEVKRRTRSGEKKKKEEKQKEEEREGVKRRIKRGDEKKKNEER